MRKRLFRKFIALVLRLSIRAMQRGWNDSALIALQAIVRSSPRTLVARIWLARAAIEASDDSIAAAAIRPEAVDNLPNLGFHLCRIADIYLHLENFDAALHYLSMAKTISPDKANVFMLYGKLFRLRGSTDDAIVSYKHAANLRSTKLLKIDAIASAALCTANAGRKDAEALYRDILDIDSQNAFAYYGLADCGHVIGPTDPIAMAIHELVGSQSIKLPNKAALHHALGTIHNRSGDAGKAFAHWTIANQIRCREVPATLPKSKADAEARCQIFSSSFINQLSKFGCQEDILVCIVGMPRSGTTLIEQILGAYPGIRPLGERTDFWNIGMTLKRRLRTSQKYPECCKKLTGPIVEEAWRSILGRMQRTAGPCKRMVTKLPEDFFELGMIKILFPKVRIIHCQRNPMDVCFSCYTQNFQFLDYTRDLYSLAGFYRLYQQMMQHWKMVLPASSVFDIQYESLVENPESVIRNVCEFIGIEFQSNCLDFHQNDNAVNTMSRWQVRQPIYRTSVKRSARYREFLSPLMDLEDVAGAECEQKNA